MVYQIRNNTTAPHTPAFSHDWLTWSLLTNPLFIILHLSSTLNNLILLTTMIKDPLKCFRSKSSYLLINLVLMGFIPLVCYILYITSVACGTIYMAVWTLMFAFINTVLAVLLLSIDRFILVSRPIMYSAIVTKSRVLYAISFSYVLCLTVTVGFVVEFRSIVSKISIFFIFPFLLIAVFFIIIIDIATWQSISKAQKELLRLGRDVSRLDTNSASYRAELKRIKTEKRFAKVVGLLLLNVVLFILPETLVVGGRVINIWCRLCFKGFEDKKASLFQVYYFPIFYLTTPMLYLVFIPKYRKSIAAVFHCVCLCNWQQTEER